MKRLFLLLVICGAGLAGAAYWLSQKTSAAPLPPRHERADRGNIVEQVNSNGKLIFKDIFVVAATEVPGRIVEIYPEAEVGKHVTKGTPLLKLDDELARAKFEEAQAALKAAQSLLPQAVAEKEEATAAVKAAEVAEEAARSEREAMEAQVRLANAKYDYAVKELSRFKRLSENGGGSIIQEKIDGADDAVRTTKEAISAAESAVKAVDTKIAAAKVYVHKAKAAIAKTDAAINGAQFKIQQAQTAVTASELALNMTLVKAPADGTILEKKVVKGQIIAPQVTPLLFTLAPDLNRMELRAQVGESDISRIRTGMTVTFTVDAYTDDASTFEGEVTLIPQVPTTAPSREGLPAIAGPVFYTVSIDVKPRGTNLPARTLRAGYTANVQFMVKKVENVLRVPTAAFNYLPESLDSEEKKLIAEKAASGWRALWTWSAGEKPQRVFVRTGANDGSKTEVTEVDEGSRLTEGAEIIIEGPPTPEAGKGLFDTPAKIRL